MIGELYFDHLGFLAYRKRELQNNSMLVQFPDFCTMPVKHKSLRPGKLQVLQYRHSIFSIELYSSGIYINPFLFLYKEKREKIILNKTL